MKLNPTIFGTASAVTTGILWIVCSILVVILPGFMESMTAGMMHSSVTSMDFTLTWEGFLWGLIAWAIWAGIAGWLLVLLYNQLLPE